jgi:hypothetical protein
MAGRTKGLRLEDLPEHLQQQVINQEKGLKEGVSVHAQTTMPSELRKGLTLLYLWVIATALLICWAARIIFLGFRGIYRGIRRLTRRTPKPQGLNDPEWTAYMMRKKATDLVRQAKKKG